MNVVAAVGDSSLNYGYPIATSGSEAAKNEHVVSSITDVTKENFIDQSNDLIQRISNAAWIAVDEEMTGISLPGTPRPSKADTPADRYPVLKKVPERYSIIQLGLCLFEEAGIAETPDGGERMNFHVVSLFVVYLIYLCREAHISLEPITLYLFSETVQVHNVST